LAHLGHLKRRTQHERLGEMPNKTNLWMKLFPMHRQKAAMFNKAKLEIEKRMVFQEKSQEIGKKREQKVFCALQSLKRKKGIKDFIKTKKLGLADLIDGIDFMVIYIDKKYKVLNFSVTGQKWVEEHQRKHPKILILVVFLEESIISIEKKILELLDKSRRISND